MTGTHCLGLQDLSAFLGFASQRIFFLVGHADHLYQQIDIPKRGQPGVYRNVYIPNSELKGVQRAILSKILGGFRVHDCARAYIKGKSVVETAKELCGDTAILKLDLADFFPSIVEKRVFWLFRTEGFNGECAHILSKLTTRNGNLAQGAPTSPMISNVVARGLDSELTNIAAAFGLRYIRYSDDLFFAKAQDFSPTLPARLINGAISHNGFTPNFAKLRYLPLGKPRRTLGLITHGETPAIPRSFRRNLRAAFFQASRDVRFAQSNMAVLRGQLEWYKSVYGRDEQYQHFSSVLNTASKLKVHHAYRSV